MSEYKIPHQPFTYQNFINGKYVESSSKKPEYMKEFKEL